MCKTDQRLVIKNGYQLDAQKRSGRWGWEKKGNTDWEKCVHNACVAYILQKYFVQEYSKLIPIFEFLQV